MPDAGWGGVGAAPGPVGALAANDGGDMALVFTGRTALDLYRLLYTSGIAIDDELASDAAGFEWEPDGSDKTRGWLWAAGDGMRLVAESLSSRSARGVLADRKGHRGGTDDAWRSVQLMAEALIAGRAASYPQTSWMQQVAAERPELHVLAESGGHRRLARGIVSHVLGRPLVAGSVLRIQLRRSAGAIGSRNGTRVGDGEEMFVTSPELTFLMLAREAGRGDVGLLRLVLAGYELCGHYLLPPTRLLEDGVARGWSSKEDGFRMVRDPLTSRTKIAGYLKRLGRYPARQMADGRVDPEARDPLRIYGMRTAERAAAHVIEHAGSPMEAAVAMMLCLPRLLGGHGVREPSLNAGIPLSRRAQLLAEKHQVVADLLWTVRRGRALVSLEYNSDMHHIRGVGEQVILADMHRGNAVGDMGIFQIALTRDQLRSERAFAAIAESVADHIGQRQQAASARMQRRRAILRVLLLGRGAVASWEAVDALAAIAESGVEAF